MDGSLCYSDFDYDDQSWCSPLGSTVEGSLDECELPEIEDVLGWQQKVFRIFHLDLVGRCGDEESEVTIELGCSCKGNHDRALPSLSSGRRGRNREI
ncbi:hypothetical protein U1Q18_009956 [Sarracenia purpurea var. burkii]